MLLFFLIIISYDCISMSLLLKLPTFSRVRRDGASILSFYILATKATVASEMSTVNSPVKITWTRLKRKSKKQLRRRNTGQSCQERNQHNFVPRVSNHFGRRETLERRLKSETRERARSSSTSSLGFSLLPRGKRERTLHNYVCLFVLPLIRSVVYCWTLAFLTQFLLAWYAFSLSKQNISFPKRLTAHHNVVNQA